MLRVLFKPTKSRKFQATVGLETWTWHSSLTTSHSAVEKDKRKETLHHSDQQCSGGSTSLLRPSSLQALPTKEASITWSRFNFPLSPFLIKTDLADECTLAAWSFPILVPCLCLPCNLQWRYCCQRLVHEMYLLQKSCILMGSALHPW